MLLSALIRRKVYKDPYTCWVCLDEETDTSKQKKEWFFHTCNCNLQIHKNCYLKLHYNNIQKQFSYTSIEQNGEEIYRDLLRGSLCSYIYYNGNHSFNLPYRSDLINSVIIKKILQFFKNTLKQYIFRSNLRDNSKYSLYQDTISFTDLKRKLPEMFKITSGSNELCPQCHKEIISNRKMNIIPQSYIYYIYDKVLDYIDGLFFVPLSFIFLANPLACLLEIGLWQFRCIFPESQLRYILNIETTKSLDIYFKSFKGISSIANDNKFIIIGLPIYLFSTVKNTFFQWPIIDIISYYWMRCVSFRLISYQKFDVDLRILKKCFRYTDLLVWGYCMIDKFIFKYITPHHIKRSIRQDAEDLMDNKIKLSKYFVRLDETYPFQLTKALAWPWLGKLAGKLAYCAYINIKRYFDLKDTDIVPGFYASPDEYEMIFNLFGMGIIGLLGSTLSWMSWKNRYERRLKTEALADEIVKQ